MATTQQEAPSRTKITFDLAAELTPEELEKFTEAAKAAKAESLTEHFLNLTIRHQLQPA